METVKIMVACGSGVATSTIAQDAIKKIAAEENIAIKIYKGSLAEIPAMQKEVDVILTTANYRKQLEVPHMSVFGLVSGVNEEMTRKKLVSLLKEIASSK
ncbi:PTS sugar transporter subunit IIB [Intestinibacter sp.]|uniref:PTS sugar transporter subunit IIB n=1 Tax=Intestinibacter sp. TaxID=1965304 RepID=UPI003F135887